MNSYYVVYSVGNIIYSDVFTVDEITLDTILEWTQTLIEEHKNNAVVIINWKRID